VEELLHSNLVHAVTPSNRGNKYFLLVKDHASNYRIAYFQRSKESSVEVPTLIDAMNMFADQTGKTVKMDFIKTKELNLIMQVWKSMSMRRG